MKINFKGTYFINGNSILKAPATNLSKFFYETKNLRESTGETFIDKDTFDYYVSVKDDKETDFENLAKKYRLSVSKDDKKGTYIPVVGNVSCPECEFNSVLDVVMNLIDAKRQNG